MIQIAKQSKISLETLFFFLLVFFLPFQRGYVYLFSSSASFSNPVNHYNWLKFYLFDILFLGLLLYVLPSIKRLFSVKEAALAALFLSLCLLSICTHSYGQILLPAWHFFKLFLASLLFFVLLKERTEGERRELMRGIATALVASAFCQSVIAIVQFVQQRSLGLKFLGEGSIDVAKGKGCFIAMGEGGRWILDRLFFFKHQSGSFLRAQGTLDHPNHLGLFLAVGLVALYALYVKAGKRERWLLAPLFFVLLLGLFVTFSRAALFTWLLASFLFIVIGRHGSVAKLALPLLVVCGALFLPQIMQRGGILNSTEVNRYADRERLLYQSHAWKMIQEHPLQGVGFRNYVTVLPAYAQGSVAGPLIVHNIFLLMAAEVGVVGAALFLALSLSLVKRGWERRSDSTALAWSSLLVGLLFNGCCDAFPFTEQQGLLILFLVMGMAYLSAQTSEAVVEERRALEVK